MIPVPDLRSSGARGAMLVAALLGPALLIGSTLTFGASSRSTAGIVGIALLVAGWVSLLVGVLVAGCLVLGWLDRAAQRSGGYASGRVSRGMLLFGWVIPVGSLWLPAREVSNLLRAAGAAPDGPGPATGVGRWWACWLGGWLLFDLGWLLPVLLTVNGRLSPMITLTVLVLVMAAALTLTLAATSLGAIMLRIEDADRRRRPVPAYRPGQPAAR